MNLFDALEAAARGKVIVSCLGRTYHPEMLSPIWVSNRCASYKTAGMTKGEQKGDWEIAADDNGVRPELLPEDDSLL